MKNAHTETEHTDVQLSFLQRLKTNSFTKTIHEANGPKNSHISVKHACRTGTIAHRNDITCNSRNDLATRESIQPDTLGNNGRVQSRWGIIPSLAASSLCGTHSGEGNETSSLLECNHDKGMGAIPLDDFLHRNISDTTNIHESELQRSQNAPGSRPASALRRLSSPSTNHTDKCHRLKKIKQYRFKLLRLFHDESKKILSLTLIDNKKIA